MAYHNSMRQEPDRNNKAPPPTVLFQHLTDSEKETLLNKNGYMYGIRIDGDDGPRRSPRTVARYKVRGRHHSDTWIKEQDKIISEIITTKSMRDLNYVHHGWSIDATTHFTPWTASRIARHSKVDESSGPWTTKRTVFQRLIIDIPSEDLAPVPEFEADVRNALEKPTTLDKFQALDRVLQLWGDVVPIVFELGAMMTISDTGSNFETLSATESSFRLEDLATYKTARVNIQGRDTNTLGGNVVTWLSQCAHPFQWSQAKIVRLIPTTDLLAIELKMQIQLLYSEGLLSYRPSVVEGNSNGSMFFDGTPHAPRIIQNVSVHCDNLVDSLTVTYSNGSYPIQFGGPGGQKHDFSLHQDEFITEVVVWTDQEATCSLQFITSKNRISPPFGGDDGTPSILSCDGGALVAFSGKVKKHPYWKQDVVHRIQTIWRHDVVPKGLTRGRRYSDYVGGAGGTPFNDWPYIDSPDAAYISQIEVRCGTYIDSIRATYSYNLSDRGQTKGPWHGGQGGVIQSFSLERGEYIDKVQGKHDDWIIQLRFTIKNSSTHETRMSPIFGGTTTSGQEFEFKAPQGPNGEPMPLSFIMGKR